MSNPSFVHLHTHSEFSLLDGASRISEIVSTAADFEMPAVALTDHGVMYGNINFHDEAKKAGIKPVLGCEVYVAVESRFRRDAKLDKRQYHLVLLAKNSQGYKNLIKLVSASFSDGFYYKPRVDKELLREYGGDLVAMSACLGGELPAKIMDRDDQGLDQSLGEYLDIFGTDDFYVELQEHYLPEQRGVNERLVEIARKRGLKLVASNDSHYTRRADADAHDVLLCIQTNSTLDAPDRMRFGTQEFYIKSQQEMWDLFKDVPDALENTLEIVEKCNCAFKFDTLNLPDPGIPAGTKSSDYMYEQAKAGLAARMGGTIPEDYQRQLDYECEIINKCDFATYMMIVRDFTDFARREGIYVGVRGSAAGSIVCYGLGITDVDPIDYGLTFERFLNPERIEMPDVDLDIQDDRRDDLIGYVLEKYGRDRVGQIATFGSLKARAAVRDCGRVLSMDLSEVDRICKMIPAIPVGVTIEQAIKENPDLRSTYERDSSIRRLIDTARTLEGLNRNVGVHAAGVLISDDPLTDHVPVQQGGKGETVAQLAKKDIQKVGLLKMDFLGLANLTILANAVVNVKTSTGIDIDILDVPLDDQKTFEMLGRGDTNGVFQLESPGMRRNVVELKPRSVRELAAIVALYRPGPMDHIPKFIRSKFGQEKIKYLHPDMEPILEETYGVICYQDQVLRIASAIAGFSLGQADKLRKAMSSKDKEVMAQQKQKFVDGAVARGVKQDIAQKIYEQIEPFAGYAFNKAHAVCYAFVAYRTAYLKANFPVQYYAALLSANMDDKDKLAIYLGDCKRLGIEVLPPDINKSSAAFQVEGKSIRFGLGAVKGVGRGVIDGLVAARETGGPFTDLFDFCDRTADQVTMNRSAIESLIKVGAFCHTTSNRAQLLEMLPDSMSSAAARRRDQENGQAGLFCDEMVSAGACIDWRKYDHVGEFAQSEILEFEKELLGFYQSGHPLNEYREALERNTTVNAVTCRELAHDQECVIGGIIADVRIKHTRRNEKMANVRVEDLYGGIDVTFFPAAFKNCQNQLAVDRIVLVKGKASHRERINSDDEDGAVEVEIRGEAVSPLREANGKSNGNGTRAVHIRLSPNATVRLEAVRSFIQSHPGAIPVYLHVCDEGARRKIATDYRVDPSPSFVSSLERMLGRNAVRVA